MLRHPLMNSYTGGADLDIVRNIPANFIHTVVIGAGPYGLSLAAHLREKGVPFRIFGRPMQTWATQMPAGMRLQSAGSALNLPGRSQPFPLSQFCGETGRPYTDAAGSVALEDFVAYGEEFARRYVPNLEGENIKAVDRSDDLFRVTTSSGEKFFTRHVVVATGFSHLQHVPAEFRHLPAARVTHPSQHRSFYEFAGRDVTVLGSGGSALHSAALLHEAGARVTLIAPWAQDSRGKTSPRLRRALVARSRTAPIFAAWKQPAFPARLCPPGRAARLACPGAPVALVQAFTARG